MRVAIWGFGREGRAALAALRARFRDKPLTVFCSAAEAELDASRARVTRCDAIARITRLAADHRSAADARCAVWRIRRRDQVARHQPVQAAVSRSRSARRALHLGHARCGSPSIRDARTICVTGTKGKSTITALIAHLLRTGGHRTALAGNIGLPLLELLDADQRAARTCG